MKKIMILIILFWVQNKTIILSQRCVSYIPSENASKTIHQLVSRNGTIEIPIVFHIVYQAGQDSVSNAKIYSQLEILNNIYGYYNPINNLSIPEEFRNKGAIPGIHFCLAKTDPFGQITTGINRIKTDVDDIGCRGYDIMKKQTGGIDIWNTKKYLNVYIGSRKQCPFAMSSFPWDNDSLIDGIIIDPKYIGSAPKSYPFHLGYTLVHEIGHYFGLNHLSISKKKDDCTTDDGVTDTPTQSFNYYNCPEYPQYSCDQSSMFMNFMSLVDDGCMQLFTKGQVDRLNAMMVQYRSELISISCNEVVANDIVVYPLANQSGQWYIHSQNFGEWTGTVQLYDLTGKQIASTSVIQSVGILFPKYTVPMPTGIYFINIRSNQFNVTKKIYHLQYEN